MDNKGFNLNSRTDLRLRILQVQNASQTMPIVQSTQAVGGSAEEGPLQKPSPQLTPLMNVALA